MFYYRFVYRLQPIEEHNPSAEKTTHKINHGVYRVLQMFVTLKRTYFLRTEWFVESISEWVGDMTQRDLLNTKGETNACGQAHPAILLPLPTPTPSTADLKMIRICLEHIRLGLLCCNPSPFITPHKNKTLKGISCFTTQSVLSLNRSKLSKDF